MTKLDTEFDGQEYAKPRADKSDPLGQPGIERQMIMLAEAESIQALFEAINQHPDMDEARVQSYLADRKITVRSNEFPNVLEGVLAARENVRETLRLLDGTAPEQRAALFYRWGLEAHEDILMSFADLRPFTRSDPQALQPSGPLELITDLPLVVTLFVQDRNDYRRFTRSAGDAICFSVDLPQSLGTTIGVLVNAISFTHSHERNSPLSEEELKRVRAHEYAHAENSIFIASVSNIDGIWCRRSDQITVHSLEEVEKSWNQDKAEARNSRAWNRFLDFALARAKDELLAELAATGSTFRFYAFGNMMKARINSYDYFSDLPLKKDIGLREALWKDYTAILRKDVEAAFTVIREYDSFGLHDRAQLMRWVLARIPLGKWEETLENGLFLEEARQLEWARSCRALYFDKFDDDKPGIDLYDTLKRDCQGAQRKSLIPFTRPYEENAKRAVPHLWES